MILRLLLSLWTIFAVRTECKNVSVDNNGIIPVIIDSDGGGDDATGILLFLWHETNNYSSHKESKASYYCGRNDILKLVAVTTVTGNTGVQNATRNLKYTLQIGGRPDIQVYPGASDGLMGQHDYDDYYGEDGFGDFLPPVKKETVENVAVDKLVELSKKYEGTLVIICIGPMTNIALAQRKDPLFLHRVKQIYMMGGTAWGIGNIRPGVEFNILQDPEAVDVVFRESPNIVTVMPYDPIFTNQIPRIWRTEVLGKLTSKRIEVLNKAESKALPKLEFWSSADPQAVAVAICPNLVTKSMVTRVLVETGGNHARGAFLVDHFVSVLRKEKSLALNVKLIQTIDINYYQQLLLLAFSD